VRHYLRDSLRTHRILAAAGHIKCVSAGLDGLDWIGLEQSVHHDVTSLELTFHDADTDILADILARIVARMSACRSACHRNNFNRACRTCWRGEDPREEVGVGVVECELYRPADLQHQQRT